MSVADLGEAERDRLVAIIEQQADRIAWLEGDVAGWRIKLAECQTESQRRGAAIRAYTIEALRAPGNRDEAAIHAATVALVKIAAESADDTISGMDTNVTSIEIFEGADEKWYYRAKAGNGEPVDHSQAYISKEHAVRAAEATFPGVPHKIV